MTVGAIWLKCSNDLRYQEWMNRWGGDSPSENSCNVRDEPLGGVESQDAHTVIALQTQLSQTEAHSQRTAPNTRLSLNLYSTSLLMQHLINHPCATLTTQSPCTQYCGHPTFIQHSQHSQHALSTHRSPEHSLNKHCLPKTQLTCTTSAAHPKPSQHVPKTQHQRLNPLCLLNTDLLFKP